MDRYGAFSRQFNSKYDDSYTCHSSDTKPDYDYGYSRRGAAADYDRGLGMTRTRYAESDGENEDKRIRRRRRGSTDDHETLRGERIGRDFESRYKPDETEDIESSTYDRRPRRFGPIKAGVDTYASDARMRERDYEPCNAARVLVSMRRDGHRAEPRRFVDSAYTDSYDRETVVDSDGGRYENGPRMPRGDRPRRRDDYDTDSELEYGENSFHAPPLRRAPELRSRFDEDYTDRTSENEPRGKREMSRLPEAGYDGSRSYDASSLDGESEYERYGRDASRGM